MPCATSNRTRHVTMRTMAHNGSGTTIAHAIGSATIAVRARCHSRLGSPVTTASGTPGATKDAIISRPTFGPTTFRTHGFSHTQRSYCEWIGAVGQQPAPAEGAIE